MPKITDYCDQHQLSTRQRLDLFIQVCRAIQHAHQKGIIHRDIKPSNVLVATQDGVPVPKVIDFGIAKATQGRLTDQTLFTAFEQFLGTPAYMSPEQTQLGALDVDTRSDIYSLGVLLYELLTGKTPFDTKELVAAGLDEMRRTIREVEPVKPSTRLTQELAGSVRVLQRMGSAGVPPDSRSSHQNPPGGSEANEVFGGTPKTARGTRALPEKTRELIHLLRGDLDWIVMKCLEKDRARRYETANGLAVDIERHLRNEPVMASPPGNLYRFKKLVRRNKVLVTATAAIAAVLVVGICASTWQAVRATRAEREQSRLRQEAQTAQANEGRERKSAETEAVRSQEVAQFLKDMLKSADWSVAFGRDTTLLRDILETAAQRIRVGLTNQPEVEADLGFTIGKVYIELSEHAKAEAMFRHVLALQTNLYGNEHTNIAASLSGVAGALLGEGKPAEAEKVAREMLAMRRKLLGAESHETVAALNLLALTLGNQGRLAEREATAREALEIERRLKGGDHAKMLTHVLHTLAYTLYSQGRFAESEVPFREALAIARQIGAADQNMAHLLNNLARALEPQGKLEEAESSYREALTLRRRLFGDEHQDVASSLANLADLLEKQAALVGASRGRGKLSEAEALHRESSNILRRKLPPGDPRLAASLAAMSHVQIGLAEFAEAESVARECLAIREKKSPDDWQTFDARSMLGISLLGQQKYAEAEPLLLSGYEGMKQREAQMVNRLQKERIQMALQRLVQLYEATGKSDQAAAWRQKLKEFERSQATKPAATPSPQPAG